MKLGTYQLKLALAILCLAVVKVHEKVSFKNS